MQQVRPQQATLVPVRPGEVTSEGGWPVDLDRAHLSGIVQDLKARGIRVSVFVDPVPSAVRLAGELGADRVELFTEPFANGFAEQMPEDELLAPYRAAAELAHELGLGVNAGHDLNLDNLGCFLRVPHVDEVSIGHALISRALFVGLERVVGEYLALTTAA